MENGSKDREAIRVQRTVAGITLVSLAASLVIGCATYTLKDTNIRTQNEPNHKRVCSWLWSLKSVPTAFIDSCDCQGKPVGEVTVRRNAWQSVITFLSLGIAAPSTIEWKCEEPNPTPGEISDVDTLYCDTNIVGIDTTIECFSLECDTVSANDVSCDTMRIIDDDES